MKDIITSGKTALGIELGSTRVKAVLIDENCKPLASGAHDWENKLENGYWTYSLEDVQIAIHSCFKALKKDVKEKYGCSSVSPGSEGSKELAVLIESKIAMHHSRDTDSTCCLEVTAVFLFYISLESLEAGVNSCLHILE